VVGDEWTRRVPPRKATAGLPATRMRSQAGTWSRSSSPAVATLAPRDAARAIRNQRSGDEQQVDRDGIGPRLPPFLSGRRGDVVQVGEGQRGGDDRLDEHRVDAGQVGAHAAAPSGFGHGRGRDMA
jgi:hypothetical protein